MGKSMREDAGGHAVEKDHTVGYKPIDDVLRPEIWTILSIYTQQIFQLVNDHRITPTSYHKFEWLRN